MTSTRLIEVEVKGRKGVFVIVSSSQSHGGREEGRPL
jgi:hypothetical protein